MAVSFAQPPDLFSSETIAPKIVIRNRSPIRVSRNNDAQEERGSRGISKIREGSQIQLLPQKRIRRHRERRDTPFPSENLEEDKENRIQAVGMWTLRLVLPNREYAVVRVDQMDEKIARDDDVDNR